MSACLICCEEKDWITLGKCNHTELCLECCYKYRSDKKNRNCILCKTDLEVVYVVKNNEDYADFSCFRGKGEEFEYGIKYFEKDVKPELERLRKIVCPIKNCKKKRNIYNY